MCLDRNAVFVRTYPSYSCNALVPGPDHSSNNIERDLLALNRTATSPALGAHSRVFTKEIATVAAVPVASNDLDMSNEDMNHLPNGAPMLLACSGLWARHWVVQYFIRSWRSASSSTDLRSWFACPIRAGLHMHMQHILAWLSSSCLPPPSSRARQSE